MNETAAPASMTGSARARRAVAFALALAAAALLAQSAMAAPAQALTGVDLSTYKRVGRFDLPEPTRTAAPRTQPARAGGLGASPTTGTPTRCSSSATAAPRSSRSPRPAQLVDSMTLAPGGSPQGTTFYDTEGITYVGGGEVRDHRGARPPAGPLHLRRRRRRSPAPTPRRSSSARRSATSASRGSPTTPPAAASSSSRRPSRRASSRPASTWKRAPRPTARRPPPSSTTSSTRRSPASPTSPTSSRSRTSRR